LNRVLSECARLGRCNVRKGRHEAFVKSTVHGELVSFRSATNPFPSCLRICFLACALINFLLLANICAASDPQIELGPIEIVMRDGQESLHYFPDGPVFLLRDPPHARVLIVAADRTELLEGPELKSLQRIGTVLAPGSAKEFDNGYAGIYGGQRLPSGDLMAIYHAEDHEEMKAIPGGIPGFYCRVGLAVSKDQGRKFKKLGPVIVGHQAKNPGGPPDQGVGEPSVVLDADRKKLLLYYTSHERQEGRGVDICLATAPVSEALNPAAWRKFRLTEFSEPAIGGTDTPVVTGEKPGVDALMPYVIYVPALKRYLMSFCVNAWNPGMQSAGKSGIYTIWSTDGIHWPRESIRQIWKVPTIAAIGAEVAWHPMLALEADPKGEVINGWMYFGHSPDWGDSAPHQPHFLIRRAVRILVAGR
jgi:hypothetical protein